MKADDKGRIKVLLSKIGLDGHDWGVLVVLKAPSSSGRWRCPPDPNAVVGAKGTVEQSVRDAFPK